MVAGEVVVNGELVKWWIREEQEEPKLPASITGSSLPPTITRSKPLTPLQCNKSPELKPASPYQQAPRTYPGGFASASHQLKQWTDCTVLS